MYIYKTVYQKLNLDMRELIKMDLILDIGICLSEFISLSLSIYIPYNMFIFIDRYWNPCFSIYMHIPLFVEVSPIEKLKRKPI